MIWSSSAGLRSDDQKPLAAQIEMASYVLLAHVKHGSLFDVFTLMKWLSMQRNHLGGYRTTQVSLHGEPDTSSSLMSQTHLFLQSLVSQSLRSYGCTSFLRTQ